MADFDDESGKPMPKLLGLVVLAAVFAVSVAFAIHGVRQWPLRAGSVLEMAALVWAVLVILGVGGAWVVKRMQKNPSSSI